MTEPRFTIRDGGDGARELSAAEFFEWQRDRIAALSSGGAWIDFEPTVDLSTADFLKLAGTVLPKDPLPLHPSLVRSLHEHGTDFVTAEPPRKLSPEAIDDLAEDGIDAGAKGVFDAIFGKYEELRHPFGLVLADETDHIASVGNMVPRRGKARPVVRLSGPVARASGRTRG